MAVKPNFVLMAVVMLAGCQGQDSPDSQEGAAALDMPVKRSGTFSCHSGAPGKGYQVMAHADVAAGANATITLDIPASERALFDPSSAILRCEVDEQWCGGASCSGKPPIDFYGLHADGLTWEAVVKGKVQTAKFTAIAHNADREAHTVRLVLEMPEQWHPLTGGQPVNPQTDQ